MQSCASDLTDPRPPPLLLRTRFVLAGACQLALTSRQLFIVLCSACDYRCDRGLLGGAVIDWCATVLANAYDALKTPACL